MAIDPSIPLGAGDIPAPPNMLDIAGKYQGIANAISTNAAIKANTAQTQQSTAITGNNETARSLSQFLMLPPALQTQGAMRQMVDDLLARGIIDQSKHDANMDIIGRIPDRAAAVNFAQRALAHHLGAEGTREAVYGSNQTRDNGQAIISGTASSPMGRAMRPGEPGFMPTGGDTQTFPSRGMLAEPTQIGVNPDGSPKYAPRQAVTPPGLAGPAGQVPGNGRYPDNPALLNPNRTTPRIGGAGSALGPDGTYVPGQGPAAQANQQARGASANASFQAVTDQGVQARSQDAILANMQADAEQFSPGAGADKIKMFQNAVTRIAPGLGAAFGVKPEALAAHESFDKLAAQIATAQGAGSDARLAVNQAGNPHSSLSPAGVDTILRQLRGNADYLKVRAKLAAAHPDQSDYRGFETGIGAKLDPRVFQYERLTGPQRSAYVKSLRDAQAFIAAHKFAEQNGLIGGVNGGR